MLRRVLSVSYDLVLLSTRAMILQQEGYIVRSVQTLREAIEVSRKTSFHVAIIGHSIPIEDQQQIAAAIRRNCEAVSVVALMRREGENVPFADCAVEAQKPEELIVELRRIFNTSGQ